MPPRTACVRLSSSRRHGRPATSSGAWAPARTAVTACLARRVCAQTGVRPGVRHLVIVIWPTCHETGGAR